MEGDRNGNCIGSLVGFVPTSSACSQELAFMKTFSGTEVNTVINIMKMDFQNEENIAVTEQFIVMSLANLTIYI
jgi:hypothetical protein